MSEEFDGVADDERRTTEVRFNAPTELVSVVDAIGFANGGDRSKVMNQVLREFVERETHRATLILRVARINPLAAEPERKGGGK